MSRAIHLLVLDAYAREGREALEKAGGTAAGRLYERMLRRHEPEAVIDVVRPADSGDVLGSGVALDQYDGAAWTGSDLAIHRDADPRVRRQVEFARALYWARVPSFGSCWAAQLCVAAVGGSCAPNPRGREFGVARSIELTPEGRAHPLYRGKPPVFDAFTSHADEVADLPPGATLLASNRFTRVQAVSVEHGGGCFWALQYHPEYDPHEVASLCRLRADELVAGGRFAERAAADAYAAGLETLNADPSREDIARELGIGADLLDEERRTLEVRNWIEACVRPRARR